MPTYSIRPIRSELIRTTICRFAKAAKTSANPDREVVQRAGKSKGRENVEQRKKGGKKKKKRKKSKREEDGREEEYCTRDKEAAYERRYGHGAGGRDNIYTQRERRLPN